MQEVFKDIPGYKGIYQISNFGAVKSLERKVMFKCGIRFYTQKESFKKPTADCHGYLYVNLYSKSIKKSIKIHQLIAMAFLNHKPCGYKLVVDHIDNNPLNNNLNNLQLISQRENSSKDKKNDLIGAYRHKLSKKWFSSIKINGKNKYLGTFETQIEAHLAYKNKLKQLEL